MRSWRREPGTLEVGPQVLTRSTWSRVGGVARHALRVAAVAAAAACAVAVLTAGAGIAAAAIGAAVGAIGGELVARGRVRLWFVAAASLALALVGLWLAGAAITYELVPDLIGPASAVQLSVVLRFGLVAFALAAALRAAGRRMRAFAVVEVVAAAAAVAIPFAAHRDGVLVRPLWLSDWAWHRGLDPALVLLVLGAVVAGVLALLLMLESDRRAGPASLVALPGLAVVLALVVGVSSPPPPQPVNDLGLTQQSRGDPPRTTPPGDRGKGGQGQREEDKQGGGQQGQKGQQQGSGQKQEQGQRGSGQQQGGQQQGGGQKQGGQQQQGGQGAKPPEEMDWNDPSQGSQSAPMAVVLLGDDYAPPSQMYYFRQEAWSEYAGARLVASRQRDIDGDVPGDLPSGTLVPPAAPDARGNQLIHADVALLVQHRHLFFLGAPVRWEPLTNPDPSRFVRAYRFESVVSTHELEELVGREAGAAKWSKELREHYLRPPSDPRFAELAERIVSKIPEAGRADPFVRAAAIKRYLDENTTYSTRHRHAGAADPTADFLFGNRIGYCVHFAHAAVYLWRSVGVPARIGVGYAVQADDRRGSSILIRGGDAHAWPELYLRGIGWVVLDIAPKRNLDPPGTPPDDDMQLRLSELARGQKPDPVAVAPVTRRDDTSIAAPAATALGALLAAALLALYAVKLWRRLAPLFARPAHLPRVGYRTALDLLAESGRSRARGETRERFAGRVSGASPAFARVTDLHVAAHFAPGPLPPQNRGEWRALLAAVQREVAATSSRWRRVLRALNPISFFAAR
jgi:protein-glutamine gamma-glutamyltransferase